MGLIQTLEQNVSDLRAQIEKCRSGERAYIAEINQISATDARGQTPHVSGQVKQLDIARSETVAARRRLQRELSMATATLQAARSIVQRK